jgi:hypothetical protein
MKAADPTWKSLYAAGAAAALVYVVMIVVPIILVFAAPQPPATGGAAVLQFISSHRSVYTVELVCFVGLSVPALVVFLALSVSLKELGKSLAAVGALIGIVSEVLALAVNSSPPSLNGELLYLSSQYMSAAEPQRLALSTAAESFIASANAVSSAGILTALGILLLSLLMLRGVFGKGSAILGIVTGGVGIVFEALRPLIGLAYSLYGLLLLAWFIIVGCVLFRFYRQSFRSPT